MNTITIKAKTLEECVKNACAEFSCGIDDVTIKVIRHPGVFSPGEIEATYIGEKPEGKTALSIIRTLEKRIQPGEKEGGKKDFKNKGKPGQNRQDFGNKTPDSLSQPQQKKPQEPFKQAQPKPAVEKSAPKQAAPAQKPVQPKENVPPVSKPNRDNGAEKDKKLSKEALAEQIKKSEEYLNGLLSLMEIKGELTSKITEDGVSTEIVTEDMSVIGYRGETLDALEHLTLISTMGEDEKNAHFSLDCAGYRARRLEALKENALRQAEKAVRLGKPMSLEPMNSSVRREVHSILADRTDVSTRSEGKEPNRYIVIFPAAKSGKPQQSGGDGKKNPQKKNGKNRSKNRGGKPNRTGQDGVSGKPDRNPGSAGDKTGE